jgi:DNA polymerase-3 subunit epsilon
LIPDEVSYSLGKLVKSLGIPLTNHHRAEGDARATLELFKLLISKDTENEIIQKQHEEPMQNLHQ